MNNSVSHFVAFGYMSLRVISCRFLFDKGLSRMYIELSTHLHAKEKLTPTSQYFHLFNLPKCPINGYFGQTDLTFKCST